MKRPLRIVKDHPELKVLVDRMEELEQSKVDFLKDLESKTDEVWRKIEQELRNLGHFDEEESSLKIENGVIYRLGKEDFINDQLSSAIKEIVDDLIKD